MSLNIPRAGVPMSVQDNANYRHKPNPVVLVDILFDS